MKILRIFLTIWLGAAPVWAAGMLQEPENLSDKDITHAVETELLVAEAVPSHLIDISTQNGVMTLSGSVNNILARDRAVELAGMIKGVRSVIDKIEVDPVPRPDNEIREDVKDALLFDPATESFDIEVTVQNGIVILNGEAESFAERQISERVAKGVTGVKDLKNLIDVSYKLDRPDREIEEEIQARLEADARVDAGLIDVQVKDGRVILDGVVGSRAEWVQAELDTWMAGVQSVDSSGLEIEWWARNKMKRKQVQNPGDEWIKEAVQDALAYDPRVWSFKLDVDVEDSVVTLDGVVTNLKAKRAAEEDAGNTTGVSWVKNFIKVRPETVKTDAEIAEDVRSALKRDTYVERHDITLHVDNAKVFLYGYADTYFEKYHAEDVVSRVEGVVEVQNNLNIQHIQETKPDWQLKLDLGERLFWSPYLNRDRINISVEDGVVTVTGTVDTWFEYYKVARAAQKAGAEKVNNRLEVKTGA
jgi:osmotically-inducible protein OsmY